MSRALLLSVALLTVGCDAVKAPALPFGLFASEAPPVVDTWSIQEVATARAEAEALRADLDAITAAGTDGDARAAALQGRLDRANGQVGSLQRELGGSAAALSASQSDLQARDAQIAAQAAQIAALQAQVAQGSGLAAQERRAYEQELAGLQADLWNASALGPQLDAALQQLVASQAQVDHLGRRVGDLRADNQTLERQLAAARRDVVEASNTADVAAQRQRIARLEAELAASKAQQDRLIDDLASARATIARLEATVASLQARPTPADAAPVKPGGDAAPVRGPRVVSAR